MTACEHPQPFIYDRCEYGIFSFYDLAEQFARLAYAADLCFVAELSLVLDHVPQQPRRYDQSHSYDSPVSSDRAPGWPALAMDAE
jgi:hypothetical protein